MIIKARKIWENGTFLGGVTTQFPFNCNEFANSSPRDAWIVPNCSSCGSGQTHQLTLEDPKRTDAIRGVWIETADGQGTLIDAESVQLVIDGCNGTGSATIDATYDGRFPDTAGISQKTTYTITRQDSGDLQARNKFRLDYLGEAIEGTVNVSSSNGTTTVYTFDAYKDPRPKGSDVISNEVPRTFASNVAPAIVAPNTKLELTIVADGVELPKVSAANVGLLAQAANANATISAIGTVSQGSNFNGFQTTKATEVLLTIEAIP